jgi:hypothetical protein
VVYCGLCAKQKQNKGFSECVLFCFFGRTIINEWIGNRYARKKKKAGAKQMDQVLFRN